VHLGVAGNVNVSVGPIGRDASASVCVGQRGCAMVYSYSCSRGAFIGVSIDGTVTHTRSNANMAFYGRPLTAKDLLLGGTVEAPPAARTLYSALNTMLNSFEYSALAGRCMPLHHSAAAGQPMRIPLDATFSVDDFSAMKDANVTASVSQQATLVRARDPQANDAAMHLELQATSALGRGSLDASTPAHVQLASTATVNDERVDDDVGVAPASVADGTSEMSDEVPYSLFEDD
jgi:hypothetical protein